MFVSLKFQYIHSTDKHMHSTIWLTWKLLLHKQTISNGHKMQLLVCKRFFVDNETVMRHYLRQQHQQLRKTKIGKSVANAQKWTKTFSQFVKMSRVVHAQWPMAHRYGRFIFVLTYFMFCTILNFLHVVPHTHTISSRDAFPEFFSLTKCVHNEQFVNDTIYFAMHPWAI